MTAKAWKADTSNTAKNRPVCRPLGPLPGSDHCRPGLISPGRDYVSPAGLSANRVAMGTRRRVHSASSDSDQRAPHFSDTSHFQHSPTRIYPRIKARNAGCTRCKPAPRFNQQPARVAPLPLIARKRRTDPLVRTASSHHRVPWIRILAVNWRVDRRLSREPTTGTGHDPASRQGQTALHPRSTDDQPQRQAGDASRSGIARCGIHIDRRKIRERLLGVAGVTQDGRVRGDSAAGEWDLRDRGRRLVHHFAEWEAARRGQWRLRRTHRQDRASVWYSGHGLEISGK